MFEPSLLGHVSTEGGPLLIADRSAVVNWGGIDSDDYVELCEALNVSEPRALPLGRQGIQGLAWNIPTGTTEVWRIGPSSVLLVRGWVDHAEELSRLASVAWGDGEPLGDLTVTSGWLVAVWATEPGESVLAVEPTDGLSLNLSVGGAGLVLQMPNGDYECSGDEVDVGNASALRCLIRPRDTYLR